MRRAHPPPIASPIGVGFERALTAAF